MNFFKNLFSKKFKVTSAISNLQKSNILSDIAWTFYSKKYQSKADFSKEIKQYQIEIKEENNWNPDKIVFNNSEIKILLEMKWEESPHDKIRFTLKNNKGEFTALELMFQLNNFIADYDLADHNFFEGLSYDAGNNVYKINLGS